MINMLIHRVKAVVFHPLTAERRTTKFGSGPDKMQISLVGHKQSTTETRAYKKNQQKKSGIVQLPKGRGSVT